MLLILFAGQVRAAAIGPLHIHCGVVIRNAALAVGVVHIGAFVAEFRHIAEHQKSICKALRNVKHFFVFLAQGNADPLAKGFAARAAVYCHIIHFAFGYTNQLSLRVHGLKMQAAQHAAGRAALVILHKFICNTGSSKFVFLIGFHKIAAAVAENSGLDNLHTGNLGCSKLKFCHNPKTLTFLYAAL